MKLTQNLIGYFEIKLLLLGRKKQMLIILEVKYLEFDFQFCLSSHEQQEPLKFTGKDYVELSLICLWTLKPSRPGRSEGYRGCSGRCSRPSWSPSCRCRAVSPARSCCCCCCRSRCPCSRCWCRASCSSLSRWASSARCAASLCCSSCSSYGDWSLVTSLAEGRTWGTVSKSSRVPWVCPSPVSHDTGRRQGRFTNTSLSGQLSCMLGPTPPAAGLHCYFPTLSESPLASFSKKKRGFF